MLRRLVDGIAWRLEMCRRYWFFLSTFRNGRSLAWNYHKRIPSDKAVLRDGTVLRHPPSRSGLPQTLLELWDAESYTKGFYRPAPGDVVIDAGANIGLFAIWLARRNPRCRILAFEPEENNFACLTDNIRSGGYGQIEALQAGLGGSSGRARIAHSDRSLDHRLVGASADDDGSVPCHSFHDALELAATPEIALCKIDIEGSEHEVFSTIEADDIRRVKRFVVEYHEHARPGVLQFLIDRLSPTHEVRHRAEGDTFGLLFAARKGG
ncbi:MAG: FkbM family methyltransferase [Gemmataceae bacterium]|nr:FkbM family methyltransferase [Gemmataceae bacterium]